MKRLLQLILVLLLVNTFGSNIAYAAADTTTERISEFSSVISVSEDGSVIVNESINYFFPTLRHGIFRKIPLVKTNQDDRDFRMVVKQAGVEDWNYQDNSTKSELNLKIGDPNKKIEGSQVYVVNYVLDGALTYFSDHDELYWNVTGNDWIVPIDSVDMLFSISTGLEDVTVACYTGTYGGTTTNCKSETKNNKIHVYTTKGLGAGEGLTVVFGFPKGVVSVNEPVQVGNPLLEKIVGILITIASIAFYFVLPGYLLKKNIRKIKKHPNEKRVVAAWFDPPKTDSGRELTAGEVGTITDKSADVRDVTAAIIQLAQKGFLRITESQKQGFLKKAEFIFTKLLDWESNSTLLDYEKKLLDAIFLSKDVVSTKDISSRVGFAGKISKVFNSMYDQLVEDKLFLDNPHKVKIKYGLLLMLSIFTFNIFLFIVSLLLLKAIEKSDTGAHAIAVANSLKNFVTSQDKQLEFQAKNQMFFEKLLPYAISLGIEKVWVDRFKDIDLKSPDWMETSNIGAFSYAHMISSFNTSMSNAVTMSSTRSSTGHSSGFSGGFSGGGGGGGGGGSW